ncbi:PilZ domain-containing protein [Novosphingobium sp. Gsoil 351]|uniref:PilZ domain-containing protein n=1 Tax=Novosphingobium sp. Gsoil 351 TaxID=2675225 RepID=UPI0012B4F945|nr:PilZ domain-containing protein [Novosphingobium sp. Gsoil 351]QGN55134.1 hypothetical protein GKE62_11825 [Novosphingobium sp. Gsoil 351]
MICSAELEEMIDVRIGSRDTERVRVWAAVDAVCSDATVSVLVDDLCRTGARIETRFARFQEGQLVHLQLPFLPHAQQGEVVWTDAASVGVRFSQPLDLPTFRIIAKAMQLKHRGPGEPVDGEPRAGSLWRLAG